MIPPTPSEVPQEMLGVQAIILVRNLRHWTGTINGPRHTCKCEDCRAIVQVCGLALESLARKKS